VTGFVEVLEVQRVVPDLIQIGAGELLLADLELDHEHHRPGHDNSVNALAHARDVELQEQRPFESLERRLEDGDLLTATHPAAAVQPPSRCWPATRRELFPASMSENGDRRAVVRAGQKDGAFFSHHSLSPSVIERSPNHVRFRPFLSRSVRR
jgi:hypothetical protein